MSPVGQSKKWRRKKKKGKGLEFESDSDDDLTESEARRAAQVAGTAALAAQTATQAIWAPVAETAARIDATCHNGDQRHSSLPISGNVALCNHVAHLRIDDLAATSSTDGGDLVFSFETRSQGGVEDVGVELARRPEGWMIHSTSSTTNVRLLFQGTAFIAS